MVKLAVAKSSTRFPSIEAQFRLAPGSIPGRCILLPARRGGGAVEVGFLQVGVGASGI